LKRHFITSRIREKAFLFASFSVTAAALTIYILSLLTLNQAYSTHRLFKNEFHWTTSLLALMAFVALETVLIIDTMFNVFFNLLSLYVAYFSLHFWLHKTW